MRRSRTSSQKRKSMVALFLLGLVLGIGRYDGPSLPGSIRDTVKFAVRAMGMPGSTVRLRAVGVPKGYIASFCTEHVCSRDRVSLVLPASGRERIELQLIANERGARTPTAVSVAADGARTVRFPYSGGLRER